MQCKLLGYHFAHYDWLIDFCADQSQGQNPDGQQDGDFMSEAKDWAGELISGQTGTGRILVGGQDRILKDGQDRILGGRQVEYW